VAYCRRATEHNPRFAPAENTAGLLEIERKNFADALEHFDRAASLQPTSAEVHNNRAVALYRLGRGDEAVAPLERAVELDPLYVDAWRHYGLVLSSLGRWKPAADAFARAVHLDPDRPQNHHALGRALAALGQDRAAMESYARALRQRPGWPKVLADLAWLLATSPTHRDVSRAVSLAREACRRQGAAACYDALAGAFSAAGRRAEAARAARQALQLAIKGGDDRLAGAVRRRLESLRNGGPYRRD
jgi:tetratricopeptide (TPR) repeat protein